MDAHGGADGAGAGELAIDGGNAVGGDQVGALAHLLEQHAHGQHAADGIAIGAGVGADKESLAVADDFENGVRPGSADGAGTALLGGAQSAGHRADAGLMRRCGDWAGLGSGCVGGQRGPVARMGRVAFMRGYSTGAFWRLRERFISSSMRAWKRPERSARKASSGTWRTPMRSLSSKRM